VLGIAHSAEVSLFVNIIPEHLAASWHKFKCVVAVEIVVLLCKL